MFKALFIRLAGMTGLFLILCGYYLFWITPDTAIQTAIIKTRAAIFVHLLGNIMVVFYLYKRRA
jgi:hypothetical protein